MLFVIWDLSESSSGFVGFVYLDFYLGLVGRRTVCGENDGRIGVCIAAKVGCIVFTVFLCVQHVQLCCIVFLYPLISYVCPCVHEQRRRSEYFSGEG